MVQRRWVYQDDPPLGALDLARELRCSPLLARLLLRRGLTDKDAIGAFLQPKLTYLHPPEQLPNMADATARVEAAFQRRERVVVFGDYDVDGVTSTALLVRYFSMLGLPVTYRLPNRLTEGYGLKASAVRELAEGGAQLIIAVDNGVSAVDAIAEANAHGIDVVVLDHHQPPAELPAAVAIVNPWLEGSEYPFKDLAGVGVTFKFVWAMCQRLSRARKLSTEFRDFLLDSLGLVALGTIADVVTLQDENRIFAQFGLRALLRSNEPGIKFLVDHAVGAERQRALEASHVGFRIGPLLNAAGRLGRAESALELLLAGSREEAERLGGELCGENERRRSIEKGMCSEARSLVERDVDLTRDRAIVLGSDAWHVGVLGIVAARLTEEFFRPTLLVAFDGGRGRGSARSIPGVHISRALSDCDECLRSHGGHEMAAGVEMDERSIEALRSKLNASIAMAPEDMIPVVEAEERVELNELTLSTVVELDRLRPFGMANPEPIFVLENLRVAGQPRRMGSDGSHLSFHVTDDKVALRAVAFRQGEWFDRLAKPGTRVSLLAAIALSTFRGERSVELHVRDIRLA